LGNPHRQFLLLLLSLSLGSLPPLLLVCEAICTRRR
jgi:hypothetical protein